MGWFNHQPEIIVFVNLGNGSNTSTNWIGFLQTTPVFQNIAGISDTPIHSRHPKMEATTLR